MERDTQIERYNEALFSCVKIKTGNVFQVQKRIRIIYNLKLQVKITYCLAQQLLRQYVKG